MAVLRCPDKDAKSHPGPQLYDGKVDSWAVGILAFEVLVGRAPFEQECKQTTCDLICYGDFVMPCFLSANAKDFIAKALCKKSATRPTITQLLAHPWVAAEARRSSAPAIHPSLLPVVTVSSLAPPSDGASGDANSQAPGAKVQRSAAAALPTSATDGGAGRSLTQPATPPAAGRLPASTTTRKT